MNDKEKLESWGAWVNKNIETLRQQYAGEWIAVIDNQVVDHDANPEFLSVRLSEQDNSFAFWEFIHSQETVDFWVKLWRGLDEA